MENARLLIDPPATGSWNMSVDQALLSTAGETGQITLRFYSWSEPTLSLGYFQNHASRTTHPASADCPFTRRASGGGAIVHDHELTYSLCIPAASRWSSENSKLYRLLHDVIISSLGKQQIICEFHDAGPGSYRITDGHNEIHVDETAFLCFQRRTDGDLVAGGYKVCGSAQRRMKNSLLQHGSLLISRSRQAPELPGLLEICGRSPDVNKLIAEMSGSIAQELNLEFPPGPLSPVEQELARQIEERQFGSATWNLKR